MIKIQDQESQPNLRYSIRSKQYNQSDTRYSPSSDSSQRFNQEIITLQSDIERGDEDYVPFDPSKEAALAKELTRIGN